MRVLVVRTIAFWCQITAVVWLLSGPVLAGDTGSVSINAIRLLAVTPAEVMIEVDYSLDESRGPVAIMASARSSDGTKLANGFRPGFASIGNNLKTTVMVMRPAEVKEHITDKMMVGLYSGNGNIFFRRSFDLSITWPQFPDPENNSTATSVAYVFDANALDSISSNYMIEKDFGLIENLVALWNKSDERDIDGDWKLMHFVRGLQTWFKVNGWEENLQHLREWRQSSPNSTALALTEASYWLAYGKSVLGSDYNPSADPFAIKLFRQRLRKAETALLDAKPYATSNPAWYEIYIEVCTRLRRDDRFMRRLFAEAIAKHPTYRQIYVVMNKYLAPIGKPKIAWDKVDEIVAKGVENTRAIEGDIAYAELYLAIGYPREGSFDVLRDTLISWPRMKTAMEERIARYPSPGNINELAAYACRAGDKSEYLKVRPQIKFIVRNMWRSNYSPDLCDRRFLTFS